jgi:hypothetical protein
MSFALRMVAVGHPPPLRNATQIQRIVVLHSCLHGAALLGEAAALPLNLAFLWGHADRHIVNDT